MMEAGKKGGTAFANLGTAAKGLGTQLKALVANPVGAAIMAIVVAVKAAKAIFDKFKESVNRNEVAQQNLSKALAPIKAIVNGITNAFDEFVEVLTKGAAAIGEFAGSVMKWLGISDQRVEDENKLAEMQIQNAELNRKYIVENSELERDAMHLKSEAAKKDQYTAQERLDMLQEYSDKQKQIAANNKDMAEKELEALKLAAEQGKNDAATNDALAEAQAKVNRAAMEYEQTMVRVNSQMSTLREEIEKEKEDAIKAQQEKAKAWAENIKKLREEYKAMVQSFDDAAYGEDPEYQIKKLEQQQAEYTAKLKDEYKQRAITKRQYDEAIYKSENWLYQQTMKIREAEQKRQEEAAANYKQIISTETQNALDAIEKEQNAAIAALDHNADNFLEMQEKVKEVYGKKYRKAMNELYVKEMQDRLAIEQAGTDLYMQYEEAQLKKSYANREISLNEFIEEEYRMQLENLNGMIDTENTYLAELQGLYEKGKIDLETYNEQVLVTQTSIANLQAEVQETINQQVADARDANIQ